MTNRRDFIKASSLAGIGAAVLAGDAAIRLSDGVEGVVPVGSRVVDIEDVNPDSAIVIESPAVPIRDWWVNEATTVAEHNPSYSPTEPVQIIVFEHHLFDGWNRLPHSKLFDAVVERGIKFYSFPASRLRSV